MDAANVDLKAFTDDFYFKLCGATCNRCSTPCLHPSRNEVLARDHHAADSRQERFRRRDQGARRLGGARTGAEVPLHFTAFHPDWKMSDLPRRRRRR
jgi:pyruvate formate lyase activating enzyme